jgi:predicted metal-dependent enzyme (double-stranded beta helix superfamily)
MSTVNLEQSERFRSFREGMDRLVGRTQDEPALLDGCDALLSELVSSDDWLPAACTAPHPQFYQQYLLHADPDDRYSVVSFVWGPGQKTPVHDHGVWGVIGMLRGAERSQGYARQAQGLVATGKDEVLHPGDTSRVSPAIGDIHQVSNVYDDRVSISIHVYGTDIGKQSRHVYDLATGAAKPFVSGYATPAQDAT